MTLTSFPLRTPRRNKDQWKKISLTSSRNLGEPAHIKRTCPGRGPRSKKVGPAALPDHPIPLAFPFDRHPLRRLFHHLHPSPSQPPHTLHPTPSSTTTIYPNPPPAYLLSPPTISPRCTLILETPGRAVPLSLPDHGAGVTAARRSQTGQGLRTEGK